MVAGGVDGPTLHHLLTWSNYRFWLIPLPPESKHWYGGYFGLSLVLIAIAGMVMSIRVRSRTGRTPCASAIATTCFAFALPSACSSPWLQNVPLIPNFSGARYLLFAAFFLSVCVGIGARFLSAGAFGSGPSRRFALLLVLVLVFADLGPTTFQQPFGVARPPSQPNPNLEAGELKNFRNFLTLPTRNPYNVMGHSQLVMRVPTAQAPHPGDLLVQTRFVQPLEEALTLALPDSPEALDWDHLSLFLTGLHLLNVRYLLVEGQHVERVEWHAPALVSGRTMTQPEGDQLLR
jgi:hypothetical protein